MSHSSENLPQPPAPEETSSDNDLLMLGHVVLRRFWLVALIAATVILLAVAYVIKTAPIYQSIVGVQVEQQEQKIINIDSVTRQDLSQAEILKTIEQSFKNRSLMERVILVNDLEKKPDFLPRQKGAPSRDDLVNFMLNRSGATLRRGTRLIDVSFSHEDPQLARVLAQSIVDQSIKLGFNQRHTAAEGAAAFLVTEADNLRAKLNKSENELQAYREKVGSVALEDRQNIVVAKLKEISSALTQVKADRLKMEADYKQVELAKGNAEALLGISSIADNPSIGPLRDAVATQQGEIANLSERYTDEHPKMIQARGHLAESKRLLNESALKVAESFRNQLDATEAREKSLEDVLQVQEKVALDLSRQAIQYHVLSRDVESDQTLYQSVLARLKETQLTMGIQPLAYRIIDPATPAVMVKPQKLKVLAMSVIAGLLLGTATVLAIHWLDTSVQSVDDAERLLRLPVLGAIPRDPTSGARDRHLPVLEKTDSGVAEAFRSLRANLLLLGRAEERKVFAITSATPGEGKTFTSCNLAIAFAQQNLRTLLIDADLRRPSVEKLLFPTHAHPGLSDYLAGQAKLDALLRESDIPNLACLTAGGRAPSPAELLGTQWFTELINEVTPRFDRIVIDTAPVNAVSDTLILAAHVQTICIVVNSMRTPRKAVMRALEQLRRIGAPISGTIVNRLPASGGIGYYYHYSSKNGYGREGVYGAGAAEA